MLKKIVMVVCFSSVLFADWSFVDISYVNKRVKRFLLQVKSRFLSANKEKSDMHALHHLILLF